MTSSSRAHALRPAVVAPLPVAAVPMPPSNVPPAPEVAERVSARAHAAGAVPGLALVPAPIDETETDEATTDETARGTTDGIRFLGAGWGADAALFARYRRRGH